MLGSLLSRLSVIALFGVAGAAIGGALVAVAAILFEPGRRKDAAVRDDTGCGLDRVVRFRARHRDRCDLRILSPRFRRIAVAPLIGAAVSTPWLLIFDSPVFPWDIAAAAAAALVCAIMARRFRIGEPSPP